MSSLAASGPTALPISTNKVRPNQAPSLPVFFLHVTKCGGTSLRAAIKGALVQQGAVPASLYELNAPHSAELAKRADIDGFILRDLLLASTLEQRDIRLVTGHFRYTEQYHRESLQNCLSVTVLRDPVDRFVSLYYYNHFKDSDYGKEHLSLEEYIAKPRARRCAEDYVRLLRGTGVAHREFATENDISSAIKNLKRFDVVGCLERLPQFTQALAAKSGLELQIETLNKSPAPRSQRHAELPAALRKEIETLCRPSIEVYEAALSLDIAG